MNLNDDDDDEFECMLESDMNCGIIAAGKDRK